MAGVAVADDARVHELSRMLGGKEITPATIEHARDVGPRPRRAHRSGSGVDADEEEAEELG